MQEMRMVTVLLDYAEAFEKVNTVQGEPKGDKHAICVAAKKNIIVLRYVIKDPYNGAPAPLRLSNKQKLQ